MAVLSNTTTKDGLIERFEFWTRLPDGTLGGDLTTALSLQVIGRINAAFEKIMPLLLGYNDQIRWDDTNHTDAPIGYVDIVSGQADYKLGHDDNTLDILNINHARVLNSATATDYSYLERMLINDPRVPDVISPNSDNSGTPTHFLELDARFYLYPEPNYSVSAGIEIAFGREQRYFTSSDAAIEPGIPKPFHELLALYAALDYVSVQRPSDTNTLQIITNKINKIEKDLKTFIDLRNPSKAIMTPKKISYI